MDERFAMSGGVKTQVQKFCLSKCIYGRKTFETTHDPVGSSHSKETKPLTLSCLKGVKLPLLAAGPGRVLCDHPPLLRRCGRTIEHRGTSSLGPCRCSRGGSVGDQGETNWKHKMKTESEQLQAKSPPPGLQSCSSRWDCHGLCLYLSSRDTQDFNHFCSAVCRCN